MHNPHDSLVRLVFCRTEAVGVLARRVLEPELLPLVDFDSLRALPTVHADRQLRTRRADLRFVVDQVDEHQRVPLYLPIEHQSTLQPLLPYRALVYLGDMWTELVREHPRRRSLPAIVPIVLAQGPARGTPRRLSTILSLTPRTRRLVGASVDLELRVDDLSGSVLDDPVARPGTLALVELTRALLHAHRNPRVPSIGRMERLGAQFDVLLSLEGPLGRDDVDALWRYVVQVFEAGSPFRDLLVDAVSRKARTMYRTIADELREEGERRGRAVGWSEGRSAGLSEGRAAGLSEGRAAGTAEAVLGVLRHRRLVVPDAVCRQILATRDGRVLQRWFERAFTVHSAPDLLADLGG